MNFKNQIFVILLSSLLMACSTDSAKEEGGKEEERQEQQQQGPAASENQVKATEATVKSLDDNATDIVHVNVSDPNNLVIKYDDAVLEGSKDGKKRKYKTQDGEELLQTKTKDAHKFKVQTMDGRLLWKVKIKEGKIKISNNDKGDNPFELKDKGDKIKVVLGDRELGSAKLKGDKVKIKKEDKEVMVINASANSYAYALLALDEIPSEEKFIIMAELMARGL